MVTISHVQKKDISANSIHKGMFSSKTIEDHTELNLMYNVISTTVMRDLKLCALRKYAIKKKGVDITWNINLPAERLVEHHRVGGSSYIWITLQSICKEILGNTITLWLVD